jgi:hypothetical protein
MTFHRKIEMSQPILGQRVCSALYHQGVRTVVPHDSVHYLSEELEVGYVVHSLLEGHIYRKIFPDAFSD